MRKKRLIALIGTLTMAAAGLVAVSAGVSSKKAEGVSAATKTEDASQIYVEDQIGWYFRTIHMWDVSFNEKYSTTEFESFLNGFYGARTTSGWDKQGTSKGWAYNTGSGDYFIRGTVSDNKFNVYFPWWVNSASIQLLNNDNWKDCSNGFKFHQKSEIYAYGQGQISVAGGSACTYAFDAVTVSKKAIDSVNKTEIAGSSIPSETSVKYNYYPNGSDTPSDPSSIDGYTFDGWYTDSSLTNPYTSQIYSSNTTIYAKFIPNATTYTINFAAGDGEGSMSPVTPTASQDYTLPSRSGKIYKNKAHFDHWDDGLGHTYEDGATVPGNRYSVGQNVTLTAIYRDYDITDGFYLEFKTAGSQHAIREKLTWNGSEGASSNHNIEDLHLDVGDSFKVVKYEDEQIKNYFGTDKADNKDGAAIKEGQLYASGAQDYVVRVEGDYDIYFNDQYNWEASNLVWVPGNTYTVVYDKNGGSGTVGNQTAYFYNDSTETGRSFAKDVYGKNTFTAPDSTKIFDGWSTNKNAAQGELKPGDMQATADKVPNPTSGNSVTLYAIWREKTIQDGYYVKIFTEGHQANIPMSLKQGSETEYVVNANLATDDEFKVVYYQDEAISESTGYHGYTELKSGDGSAKDSNELTGTDNIVASKAGNYEIYYESGSVNHGIWAPNLIDVTFNANGHGTAPSALVVRNGNPITDPGEITGVDGWIFTGWYEDQSCQTIWEFKNNLTVTQGVANYTIDSAHNTCSKVLYAGWEEETTDCTVYFESSTTEWGNVDKASVVVKSDAKVSISGNTITLGDEVVTATATESTEDITYAFAFWSIDDGAGIYDGLVIYADFTRTVTDLGRAKEFAQYFIEKAPLFCDEDGHTELETLQFGWNMGYTEYSKEKYTEGAKSILASAKADSQSENVIEKFAASYDYIYGKYGDQLGSSGGNFANRNVTPSSSSRLISINDVSASTWVIASVAIVGIAAVGVFFIYRKRKEN